MRGWQLFRWVLWRGLASGVILGAVFLYVGIFWGAVLGAVFGIVNGVALVVLTHLCFTPMCDRRHYRWSSLFVSIASTTAISLLWASGVDASPEVTALLTLVSTTVAVFFAWHLPVAATRVEVHSSYANAVLFYIEK